MNLWYISNYFAEFDIFRLEIYCRI